MTEEKLIYTKISEVMRAVGAIGKNNRNTGQGYNFRGIDDLYNALQEHLSAAGIFAVPKVLKMTREERTGKGGGALLYTILDVEYTFYAADGSSVVAVMTGEAMDSGDKSCSKAQSAAFKYALMQIFCIPTQEKLDTEYETHEVTPRTPPQQSQQRAPQSPQDAPERTQNAPNGSTHVCPKCAGSVWDNRAKKATGEISAKSPDFKCKDRENCDGAIWPTKQ